jgi:hypothetical protein
VLQFSVRADTSPQFVTAGRGWIRMQIMNFWRDTAPWIFSDLSHLTHLYHKEAYQERARNAEFQRKVTWPDDLVAGKKRKFLLLPMHFPEGKRNMQMVFRCKWIPMASFL